MLEAPLYSLMRHETHMLVEPLAVVAVMLMERAAGENDCGTTVCVCLGVRRLTLPLAAILLSVAHGVGSVKLCLLSGGMVYWASSVRRCCRLHPVCCRRSL